MSYFSSGERTATKEEKLADWRLSGILFDVRGDR